MQAKPLRGIVVNTRVLHAPLTGVQRYTLEIVSRLGSQVEPVAPRRPAPGMLGHAWEQVVLPLRARSSVLWSPANTGPLAVHRQVVTIHDMVPWDHPEWLNPAFARWYRYLQPRLARLVWRVITVAGYTQRRIMEAFGLAEERVIVVPGGVDPRFHPRGSEEIARARAALSLPEGRYLLSLCSLEPRKNLRRLLRAWNAVAGSLPTDLFLVLAGGRGRESVFGSFDLGRRPPRVVLTGRVADGHLPALYSGALGFVYPSLYEGFGLPPLEAMASGTAVLTGNRTSLPEVVGNAALTVDPYDEAALADGLLSLVTDDAARARMQRAGIERAKQFSWDRAAQRIGEILTDDSNDFR